MEVTGPASIGPSCVDSLFEGVSLSQEDRDLLSAFLQPYLEGPDPSLSAELGHGFVNLLVKVRQGSVEKQQILGIEPLISCDCLYAI
jgi:hypothetical protein